MMRRAHNIICLFMQANDFLFGGLGHNTRPPAPPHHTLRFLNDQNLALSSSMQILCTIHIFLRGPTNYQIMKFLASSPINHQKTVVYCHRTNYIHFVASSQPGGINRRLRLMEMRSGEEIFASVPAGGEPRNETRRQFQED
jgi:hypothetical protein